MERSRRTLAFLLLLASGFSALGLQVAWTQQAAVWLGHDGAAVLAVVAAFFAGFALGAWALGARIAASAHPGRWYAACEAAIGLWALALAFAFAPAGEALLRITGADASPARQWFVAFAGTTVLLLPATAAMGATLPAMERAIARWQGDAATIAGLYAGNTFGAVLGVLAMAFYVLPAFGIVRSAILCAGVSLAVAAVAGVAFGRAAVGEREGAARAPTLLAILAFTGLLGIGYEVLAIRVLRQSAENTVYTFAMLLAVYLVGTAGGAAAYARWGAAHATDARMRRALALAMALAACTGVVALGFAPHIRDAVRAALGDRVAAALAGEAAMAVAAFLVPCIAMGALFSQLAVEARAVGVNLGRVFAANTLGAALAPVAFGVLLLPFVGAKAALVTLAISYLLLSIDRASLAPSAAGAAAIAIAAILGPSLAVVDVPPGGRIVRYEEGSGATVSVVDDAQGARRLRIDNRQQEGGNATLHADGRQALLPLALHPQPRRVLFLGLGAGVTAAVAAADPDLRVEAVELLPEVVRASADFRDVVPSGFARLHVSAADARRYVRASGPRYDVIVSDNFHPARSGSAALYTVEHFEAVRGRLAPGGLFCQWLPLHQMDLATLRPIVAAFVAAFPDARAVLATNSVDTPVVGLVAREGGRRWTPEDIAERLARAPEPPGTLGLDALAVMGSFVAGPQALARFADGVQPNTDDRPVVAFRAPALTYAADSRPRDRLLALLHAVDVRPDDVMGVQSPWSGRLADYWAARDLYLETGTRTEPSTDARRMLAQVREPLLAALNRSPDFRPAYDPLLRLAVAVARDDPREARTLLTELQRVQPQRPEASAALQELNESSSPLRRNRGDGPGPNP